ncbi:MAG: PPC domain-containing protein [bacterium]|nr:PPC domain-containing protein [bacterium]
MDAHTEWGEVFDALTTTEQECIRDSFEGDLLESVLGRPVMSESDTPEAWEVLMFSCLAPQTARAVFLALLVAGMEEDGLLLIDADAEVCLDEWVAGIDVVATMVALSADDAEAAGEVTTAFMSCNPDLFISLMLEETGMNLENLSEEEATCLREWAAGTDWATLLAGDDLAVILDFLPDLFSCAPDLYISFMLEGTGLTLEDFSEEEANCLREWVTDFDWATLFTGFADDPMYLLELWECVPDLSWSEPGGPTWDQVIEEATPLGIGVVFQGEIDYGGDRDYFAFEAEEGELYDLDVTLGTLEDSVLELYDSDGTWLDSRVEYASKPARPTWHAPGTGTYYVHVTSFYGTGTYTLTIAVSDIVDDHSNSTTNATSVEVGVATPGELEYADDRDYFAFEAEEGELYDLDVTLPDSLLDIYDTDGTRLTSHVDYASDPARFVWTAPATGTYYVRVSNVYRGTGAYTLAISSPHIGDDHPDLTTNATPVEVGVPAQGGLGFEGDSDFFTFEAEEGEWHHLDATLEEPSLLDIYDADGTWLTSRVEYASKPARPIWHAPSTGTYYIRVTSFGTGPYTFTISSA